jgi:hypothetical protein
MSKLPALTNQDWISVVLNDSKLIDTSRVCGDAPVSEVKAEKIGV